MTKAQEIIEGLSITIKELQRRIKVGNESYDHLSLEYKKLNDSFGAYQNENSLLKKELISLKDYAQKADAECRELKIENDKLKADIFENNYYKRP